MSDIIPYLRSAAVHPDGFTYMPQSWLREQAIQRGLLRPFAYGVVQITALGRAELEAEPKIEEIDPRILQLADDGCPHA